MTLATLPFLILLAQAAPVPRYPPASRPAPARPPVPSAAPVPPGSRPTLKPVPKTEANKDSKRLLQEIRRKRQAQKSSQ